MSTHKPTALERQIIYMTQMGSQEELKKSTRTPQKLKFIKDIRLQKTVDSILI